MDSLKEKETARGILDEIAPPCEECRKLTVGFCAFHTEYFKQQPVKECPPYLMEEAVALLNEPHSSRLVEPPKSKPSVKFQPMQSREVATRVSILNPESQEQVQAIISAPEGGVIATIEKETLEAFAHFKHFSNAGKLHAWVETLPANEASNKAYKHRHEYRKVVPGMEVQQVKDLLSKLPEMARKLEKSISKAPRVRFGFAFWVNIGNKAPLEVTPGITLDETTGDIVKGLMNPTDKDSAGNLALPENPRFTFDSGDVN